METKEIKIMSYNLQRCVGMDGAASIERIAEVIKEEQPDILAVQELEAFLLRGAKKGQTAQLAANLDMNYEYFPVLYKGYGLFALGVFSKMRMKQVGAELLPGFEFVPDRQPRGVLWIEIDAGFGLRIQLINTHLSVEEETQALEIDRLLGNAWVGKALQMGTVVFCGDFNASPHTRSYQRVSKRLKDAHAGKVSTGTWPSSEPENRIDYIFLDPNCTILSSGIPCSHLATVASDHLPVTTSIELKASESSAEPIDAEKAALNPI